MLHVLLWVLLWIAPGHASTPGAPAALAFKERKSREELTAEQEAAEAEAERKRREMLARVIVLKWQGTSTDYTNDTVQRNVRSRIARPDAMFFPEVDLYQNGRKVPGRTVTPAEQPAIVPDSNIPKVMAAVQRVQNIPWDGMSPSDWGMTAQDLRATAELIWFVDRRELREPLFQLYIQIARAAENANHPVSPFYERVGTATVNYYYYLAAQLAYQEPGLLGKITDPDAQGAVSYLLQQLQQGAFPSFKLDFEQENHFDWEQFNKDYEVYINGLPVEVDANARLDAFLGRTDIYLKRKDTGHGLSERLEVLKFDEKAYFVRDVARKMMGLEFIKQLFLHKNECVPELDGDILNFLSIYQKLHPKAEIYVAVPENGNPNKVWIWRWDPRSAQLKNVGGGPDTFPVRFVALFSTGILYNGAAVSYDTDLSDEESLAPGDVATTSRVSPDLDPAAIPFNFELRGHYNRLMVAVGAEFGYNANKDAEGWVEYYQTPGNNDDEKVATLRCPKDTTKAVSECEEVLNERTFNRYLWFGAGVVFGRDAGIGFGPRLAFRFGWTNMPHGLQTTGHFGWAIQPPVGDFGGRVRPLVELDARAGAAIALKRSLQLDLAEQSQDESQVMPVFGITAGAGFTF